MKKFDQFRDNSKTKSIPNKIISLFQLVFLKKFLNFLYVTLCRLTASQNPILLKEYIKLFSIIQQQYLRYLTLEHSMFFDRNPTDVQNFHVNLFPFDTSKKITIEKSKPYFV